MEMKWALVRFQFETEHFRLEVKDIRKREYISSQKPVFKPFAPKTENDFNRNDHYWAKWKCENEDCTVKVEGANHYHFHRCNVLLLGG